ncbi:zf-TFIIB domain-containing protein [uncultured Roseovarius sp.]|uniref:TFIIB-type zinc ribbon-containing protein n=1 Tax=uncultured Roseovarius sp. TaxID=293344 RepID=UPI00263292EA|nr:zf-TFIIB domain-containing protein [uncultured Roseovarius sp.]
MQCPIDGTQLILAERTGVEIDYCPQCRGVWLDRGELDKIIDRAAGTAAAPQAAPDHGGRGYSDRGHSDHGQPRRKKRGGFLEDLFDF